MLIVRGLLVRFQRLHITSSLKYFSYLLISSGAFVFQDENQDHYPRPHHTIVTLQSLRAPCSSTVPKPKGIKML